VNCEREPHVERGSRSPLAALRFYAGRRTDSAGQ